MGRKLKRGLIGVVFSLLSGPWVGATEKDDAWKTDSKMMFPVLVFEMDLEPSTTNAWSLSKSAFEAVRQLQGKSNLSAGDKAALEGLAAEYDQRLSPSLRNLRHAATFGRMDLTMIPVATQAIIINAKRGRASVPIDPNDKSAEIDVNGPPQPTGPEALDDLREMSSELAGKARTLLKEGLLEIRSSKVDGLSPEVRKAYLGMLSAFEKSISVALRIEELVAPKGPVADANKAFREFLELSNKELKFLPDARANLVVIFKRAAVVVAQVQFELAKNSGESRFLHGELDKLGPLKRP